MAETVLIAVYGNAGDNINLDAALDEPRVRGSQLPERITCTFMANNAQCRKRDCPFFPEGN